MTRFTRLADIDALLTNLPAPDAAAQSAARAHQDSLTKPPGSLGRLEDIAVFLAGWQAMPHPQLSHCQALVFAGNHGVCAQGVNAFPQSVTEQMVLNFTSGGAAINQLCQVAGADLSVIPLAELTPTRDFTTHEALTEAQVLDALNRGADALNDGGHVVILGEMGIGNSTVAAALCAALIGGAAEQWIGPGTGADSDGLKRKTAAVSAGLERHAALLGSPLAILRALGGYEQAALCGAILGARMQRTPVILDGFICSAAAAVLHAIDPRLLDHCLVGHISGEPGHEHLLAHLDKRPLLDLGMRLGEGTGAAVAVSILRAAVACHNGMATFEHAGVSQAAVSHE